jgi:putative tryptophan/tyrosine transport system substrate-binding protein
MMFYGTNVSEQFRRAGGYIDKILKGAKPANLPVEQPTTFDLIINQRTARALGLTIPAALLLQVNQVRPDTRAGGSAGLEPPRGTW